MSVPILTVDDTARARTADPLSSHVAADKSAASRRVVADAVLWLIDHYGPMNGVDLCHRYRVRQKDARLGWPVVAYESPRKRAGELVRDGYLVVLNPDDPRGTPHVYAEARFELVEPPVGEVLS